MGDKTSILSDLKHVLINSTNFVASSSLATPSSCTVISDSGANSTFFRLSDSICLANVVPTTSPVSAILTDGTTLLSTHEGYLLLDFLPINSRHVHIFPDTSMRSSLIGIGIFTDAGFKVVYDFLTVLVIDSSGNVVLIGDRDASSKLWIFTLKPPTLSINNTIHFTRHADRALYYNRCFCSCANSTMQSALLSKILVIPDLPLLVYTKNLPNQLAQSFGHLDRLRQGLRSTKRKKSKSILSVA